MEIYQGMASSRISVTYSPRVFGALLSDIHRVKLADMTVATDPRLVTQAWETKRLDVRKQIKIARKQLTMEVQGWDKMLAKYES